MAKHKKFIAMSDVTKIFKDPPTRPFFVTLKKVTDTYEDGSERFPFTSMKDAENAIIKVKRADCRKGEYDVVVLDCAPDCKRAECPHPHCRKQLCTEHGLGLGIYYRDPGIAFNFQKCINCEKVACEWHSTLPFMFMECDVCSSGYAAVERSGGDSGVTGPFPLCQNCGTICKRRVKCDDSVLHSEDEESECEDTDDSECCGLFCCINCIDEHRCGYTFQDI
jgi:hypothetical protein